MDVVTVILKPVVELLMAPVKEHLGCMIFYGKCVVDMRNKMDNLNAARVGVEDKKKQNIERCLEVPAEVGPWLIEVEQIMENLADFPRDEVLGCLELKSRHKLGRKALKISKKIDSVLGRRPQILGNEPQIPLGRIDSTSKTPSSDHKDFESRVQTYNKALEALGPDHKHHMVALWGMGGVGKTTMMEKLRQAVKEKKMFSYFVFAVIGQNPDVNDIQDSIARYLGIQLNDRAKHVRVEKLCQGFKAKLTEGKKFLVILDDVWQPFDLKDIGLSPSPNQGLNFKVLLTSRNKSVCTEMGVKADSILEVGYLTEAEAQSLFRQHWEPSDDEDLELHKIGKEIVRKCCGLPIAIKTMACTLRSKGKDTWKNALSRLEHHGINTVGTVADTVFKTSYENLKDKVAEATFLLCGLFPEDFNIPIEDLLRYGWGLNLFNKEPTIREARYMMNTCIELLMHTNLLIKSNKVGYIKMHDLVRDFVLNMLSKVEHASIVDHSSKHAEWPETEIDVSASCKRISLTCKGMIEFPSDLKFPNVSILKLMHGDKSLRFPRNFYEKMGKLQVISYDHMESPLLSSSLECRTNIRVLRLHQCSLMFDFSSIGNLLNLEVLSFAKSDIKSLPSTIGKLKKLRVLDVTGCRDLHIDNGVFKNLVRLEELWAFGGGISFTGDSCDEVAERWKNLSALEFEFHKNNAQLKNLSFENLERFKISVGRSLKGEYLMESKHSFENTLKLVSKKGELYGSRINELFEKTVVLCLSVDDMNDLEDVWVKSSFRPQSFSFCNLSILVVSECAELKCLFTLSVAKVLSNLKHLEVFDCLVMKELIHIESTGGEERVTFPKLTSLSLRRLPELLGLCQNVNIIALPQLVELKVEDVPNITSIFSKNKSETSFLLREEVLIPKLESLHIKDMDNLVNIFPCNPMPLLRRLENLEVEGCGSIEALFNIDLDCVAAIEKGSISLRSIDVFRCNKLVDLFPCNPMPLLCHLEELKIGRCGSIEALFNIELDCDGETGEGDSSSLRSIEVRRLEKLREVWRIKGGENNSRIPIRGFKAVESIKIEGCERFRNVFSPTTTNFDLGALTYMKIYETGEIGRKYGLVESGQGQENTLFPSCPIHSFHNLRNLKLGRNQGVEVIFEITSTPTSQDNQQRILPHLEVLDIKYMEKMSRVWKCNWNEFLIPHRKPSDSPFHNLTAIEMRECKSIKYLFSPLMAKLLSKLKKVQIEGCYGIEELVSNRDDEDEEKITYTSTSTHTSTTLFPLLDSLILDGLKNLKYIGGGGAKGGNNEIYFSSTTTSTCSLDQYKFSQGDVVSWSLCQYPRKINICCCDALSSVIPCYVAGQTQKLQVLKITLCNGMKEVFETQGINKRVIMLKLTNLKILNINSCALLEHIFTFSTLESLVQLEELRIKNCKAMKVIVVKEEDDGEQTTKASSSKAVVFPRLKCIELFNLRELVGFFLGTNEFHWPSLDMVEIFDCPEMKVFTAGGSTATQLKYVETNSGKYSPPGSWFNSHHVTTPTTGHHQETSCPGVGSRSSSFSAPTTSEESNIWSFHNLIELHVKSNDDVKKIIPSSELLQLQKLEKIQVSFCGKAEEVFEALEGTNRGFDESQITLVRLPNLTQVKLEWLLSLRHIWTSNRCTVFEFPNLTRVDVSNCFRLEHVFSSSMVSSLLQLQELQIIDCENMVEVFVQDGNIFVEDEEEQSNGKMNEILRCMWKSNRWTLFEFPNLTRLFIKGCHKLEHVFSSSMVGSLLQLQELQISHCQIMEEVFVQDRNNFVEEEESDGKMNEIVFPRLKSLELYNLPCLKVGVCIGKADFSFPLLDTLTISKCPAITTFTTGNSSTPVLIGIETGFGSFYVEEDINSFIKMKQEEFKRDNVKSSFGSHELWF